MTHGGKNDNENQLSIDATSFKISHSSGKINEKRTPTGDNYNNKKRFRIF